MLNFKRITYIIYINNVLDLYSNCTVGVYLKICIIDPEEMQPLRNLVFILSRHRFELCSL